MFRTFESFEIAYDQEQNQRPNSGAAVLPARYPALQLKVERSTGSLDHFGPSSKWKDAGAIISPRGRLVLCLLHALMFSSRSPGLLEDVAEVPAAIEPRRGTCTL